MQQAPTVGGTECSIPDQRVTWLQSDGDVVRVLFSVGVGLLNDARRLHGTDDTVWIICRGNYVLFVCKAVQSPHVSL